MFRVTMKYFNDIEDQTSLRALVLQDMKDLGIKPPKSKKNKPKEDSVDYGVGGVFGTPLYLVQCNDVDSYGPVPKFLVDACTLLEKHIELEGLFRRSGSVARQKELKQQGENGGDFNDAHPFDVASLVKQFFRELPDPLLTARLHDTFLKCHQVEPEHAKVSAILLLCHLLPMHHLSTLRFTMCFLRRIADRSHDNKMDVPNLAVCLAPNLLHTNQARGSSSSKMNHSESKLLQIQTSIVQYLITNADSIGMVSDSLYERTTLMVSCFTPASDDELEKSHDGHINDSSKTTAPGSGKKKKRTGSFHDYRRRSESFVSNLSNSFSRLRRDSKDRHNQSTVSEKSSMSILSVAGDKSTAAASGEHIVNGAYEYDFTEGGATPRVIRAKRKADGDAVPFSASKKKAILQNMPQMSTLGGTTPFKTPARKRRGGAADPGLLFPTTPRMKMEHMLLSPASSTKVKRSSSGKSSCFTPKTPKSNVRRKMKGLMRRLSGGKDAPSDNPSTSMMFNSSDMGLRLGDKDGGEGPDYVTIMEPNLATVDRSRGRQRRRKTPSSPARLVGNLLNGDEEEDEVQMSGLDSSCSSLLSAVSSNPSISSLVRLRHRELPQRVRSPATSSEISEVEDDVEEEDKTATASSLNRSGLRRGKPNTMRSGLPSPAKRRSVDRSSMMVGGQEEDGDGEVCGVLNTVDTSPIQKDAAMASRTLVDEEEDPDLEPVMKKARSAVKVHAKREFNKSRAEISESRGSPDEVEEEYNVLETGMKRQSSTTSIMSVVESDHDRAFIHESMLADLDDSRSQATTPESVDIDGFKMPVGIPKTSSSQLQNKSVSHPKQSTSSDASDASICTVITTSSQPESKLVRGQSKSDSQLSGAKSLESIDSGIGCDDGKLAKSMSLQSIESSGSSDGSRKESPSRDHSLMTVSFHRQPSVKGRPNLHLSSETQHILSRAGIKPEDEEEVQGRHESPLRFPNSQIRKRGVSPIRIPTIFAKADHEACQKYKEMGRLAVRNSPKSRRPNLPIGTGLVNAVSVQNARSRLTEGRTPPGAVERPNNAGHTPKNMLAPKSMLFVKDSENWEHDSALATPKIKPMLMTTDVTKRVLALLPPIPGDTPLRKLSRSPMKPVKRLQGSPKSPRQYSTSPRKILNKSGGNEQRLSPLPKHMDEDWDV